ncbi:putative tripartite motif-containing protein 61 [Halichoerus grypus]
MAYKANMAQLQAETHCPICLDYPRDPMTLCCRSENCPPQTYSIRRQNKYKIWKDTNLPYNRKTFKTFYPTVLNLKGLMQKHFGLTSMLDLPQTLLLPVKSQMSSEFLGTLGGARRSLREEEALCERHSQALALVREKDLELLCPQCKVSCGHRGHPLTPVEQAAAGHGKQLQSYTKPLQK